MGGSRLAGSYPSGDHGAEVKSKGELGVMSNGLNKRCGKGRGQFIDIPKPGVLGIH